MEIATLAGGCFWCTEAIFKNLKGIASVLPGYSGGDVKNPTYEEVSSGKTGHAEAIQIEFDPNIITFKAILYVFMKTHDPTSLNQQGADAGTQYRSAIFYHSDSQKKTAEALIKNLQKGYKSKIVTEITKFTAFYAAENYHKNYYKAHKNAPYCRLVIDPKLKKLRENFSNLLA